MRWSSTHFMNDRMRRRVKLHWTQCLHAGRCSFSSARNNMKVIVYFSIGHDNAFIHITKLMMISMGPNNNTSTLNWKSKWSIMHPMSNGCICWRFVLSNNADVMVNVISIPLQYFAIRLKYVQVQRPLTMNCNLI